MYIPYVFRIVSTTINEPLHARAAKARFSSPPPPQLPLFFFTFFPGRPPLQDVAAATNYEASFSAEGTEDSEPDFHVEVKGSALEVRLFVLVISAEQLLSPPRCRTRVYRRMANNRWALALWTPKINW